jgi:glyoxylase-like metal-dependent hydrolase (beta-lactamase superfamily II)
LEKAAGWSNAAPSTVALLAGEYLVAGRDREGYAYFRDRARRAPERPLFLALEGLFQVRLADEVFLLRRTAWVEDALRKLDAAAQRDPGLSRYFRALVWAQLPERFGKQEAAVRELQAFTEADSGLPAGLLRNAFRQLARVQHALGREPEARASLARSGYRSWDGPEPEFTTDLAVSREGLRFGPPALKEVAPNIFVATGFDFSEMGFIITPAGVLAIDAGTGPTRARAAIEALRQRTSIPITHFVATHAHFDHVGGLAAVLEPGTRIYAAAGYERELAIDNTSYLSFRSFLASDTPAERVLRPDVTVETPTRLDLGGVRIDLIPAHSGETEGALFVFLPEAGVLFSGDVLMPFIGVPNFPEGSPEGFLAALEQLQGFGDVQVIAGHTPISTAIGRRTWPGLQRGLRHLHGRTLELIHQGAPLAQALADDPMPDVLADYPEAVLPFTIIREGFVKRMYAQRTGYWQPDGQGLEVHSLSERAAAVDLLAGNKASAFRATAASLRERGDFSLALEIVQLGLAAHPGDSALAEERLRVLDKLRQKFQSLNPFKFLGYSEWRGESVPLPPEPGKAESRVIAAPAGGR